MMTANRKILVALNDSDISLKAVKYVAEMNIAKDFEVCLLNVSPEPPPYYYLEGNSYSDYVKERTNSSAAIFDNAINLLMNSGIEKNNISTRVYISEHSETISDAVMAVQKEGPFGTVVVGKRGVSKKEEFIFGSISNAIAQNCSSFTVWIVS